MSNHVTQAERDHLRTIARTMVRLDDAGNLIGGLPALSDALARREGVSRERASGALSYWVRQLRREQRAARKGMMGSKRAVHS